MFFTFNHINFFWVSFPCSSWNLYFQVIGHWAFNFSQNMYCLHTLQPSPLPLASKMASEIVKRSIKTVYVMFIYFIRFWCFSAIDTVLSDILPKNVYFRWNPNMSADIPMDEGRIEMLEQIQFDARRHLEKVDDSLKTCARSLLQSKTVVDRSMDKFRAWYRTTWDIVKSVLQKVIILLLFVSSK